jgi:hypothetical protein
MAGKRPGKLCRPGKDRRRPAARPDPAVLQIFIRTNGLPIATGWHANR